MEITDVSAVPSLTSTAPADADVSTAVSAEPSGNAAFVGAARANGASALAQSTSKVDLQQLAALDAQFASNAATNAAPGMSRAIDTVVERASAAIAQASGQPPSREALGQEARDIIERIAWEVVPELAEVIIREEIQRLLKSR